MLGGLAGMKAKMGEAIVKTVETARYNEGGAQVNLFGQESKVRNMVWEIVNPIKAMIKVN